MPKNIADLKEKILLQASKQVLENGYDKTTMRTIAKGCCIAVGTLYNYYPSKEYLIASFMLDDWLKSLEKVKTVFQSEESLEVKIKCMYQFLLDYQDKYKEVFASDKASKDDVNQYLNRHIMLKNQLAEIIDSSLPLNHHSLASSAIAQLLIGFSHEDVEFDKIAGLVKQLLV